MRSRGWDSGPRDGGWDDGGRRNGGGSDRYNDRGDWDRGRPYRQERTRDEHDRAPRFRDDDYRGDGAYPPRRDEYAARDDYPKEPSRRNYFDGDIRNVRLRPEDYSSFLDFDRVFYTEHPNVRARSAQDVARIRAQKGITVHPPDCCAPALTFEEAFSQSRPRSRSLKQNGAPLGYILESVRTQKFNEPTPIQCQSWPVVLSGHNMIGIAETGSGKTLAYLLPAIIHMLHQPELAPGEGPMALIMAPTRELTIQIFEECEKFGKPCGVKSTVVYGGAKKAPQIRQLQDGVHLLVATPGRLIDMLDSNHTNLRRVTYLVLDEADRMLDMGFEPQIRKIVDQVRPDRQTVLWSATWPEDVQDIAAEFLRSPYRVTIGSETLSANHNITQLFQKVAYGERKLDKLIDLLKKEQDSGRVLVFCATKTAVDDVTLQLRKKGFGALGIHGDKEQPEREWVLEEFKRGSSPIMVATDVAQRGLDIKDVYCVVNYDLPNTGEDYVHRIGRTGRAGCRGLSVSFFTERDSRIAKSVIRVLEEAGQEIPMDLRRFAQNVVSEPSFRGGRQSYAVKTGSNAVPLHRGWGN